jgi:hypothetical protein
MTSETPNDEAAARTLDALGALRGSWPLVAAALAEALAAPAVRDALVSGARAEARTHREEAAILRAKARPAPGDNLFHGLAKAVYKRDAARRVKRADELDQAAATLERPAA